MLFRSLRPRRPTAEPSPGIPQGRALAIAKTALVAVVFLFACASAYTSKVIGERHAALQNTTHYSSAWQVIQATTELERLLERVGAHSLSGVESDDDEIRLRFDILKNRAMVFNGNQFRFFLNDHPDFLATATHFGAAIAQAEPLVDRVDNPGIAIAIRHILLPLESELAELSGATFAFGAELAAADQKELLSLHRKFAILTIGLITCSLLLICLLVWHNGLLAKAQRALKVLTLSVQKAFDQRNAALDNMSQGLCMVDDQQRLIICNARFLTLFGLTSEVAQANRSMADIFGACDVIDHQSLLANQGYLSVQSEGRFGSYLQEMANGCVLAVSHQPMPNGGWVATYEDITERRQVEARLAHMAHHDSLTDLPNRAFFRQQVDSAFELLREDGHQLAVLALDLDRFKAVNDTLGHPQGDKLLCEVARRLSACEGVTMVARFGGDEFAILQRAHEQPQSADTLARRVIEAISRPYYVNGNEISIGTSVGISIAGHADIDELMSQADVALYRAKQEGRGTYRFFDPDMDAELQTRRLMELDLHLALARSELEMHYQPIVRLETDEIVAYEALMRWNRLGTESIPPSVFIPLAEEIGLITAFGNWAIEKACQDAAEWPGHIKVAVNLSPVQFRYAGLVPVVRSALDAAGLSPRRLELEITESVLLQDNQATLETLHALRDLGVRIAMDDFGTGFSSLSYLRSFPFDKIKIDRSFVMDSDRKDGVAILESVASLAGKLRMSTTAEGIETLEQLARVREAGCTEGQGYLFARPRRVTELVHEQPARSAIVHAA